MTSKDHPTLTLIDVDYVQGRFKFTHPNLNQDLWIDPKSLIFSHEKEDKVTILEAEMKLLHLSQTFDAWFEELLGQKCKLMYYYEAKPLRPVRPKYAQLYPETFKSTDVTTCNFSSQATLISWASIDEINALFKTPFSHLRYRSNLTVTTLKSDPYQEDEWKKILIGDQVELHFNKHCTKCTVINIDPVTGDVDPNGELLKTLSKVRKLDYGHDPVLSQERKKRVFGPPLSINCSSDQQGWLQVGDPIFVME